MGTRLSHKCQDQCKERVLTLVRLVLIVLSWEPASEVDEGH